MPATGQWAVQSGLVSNHSAHGRNLRKGRISESGRIYFITSSCHARNRIFASRQSAEIMMTEFACHAAADEFESLAYVVMPDHIHWLIQLRIPTSLHEIVRRLKGRSARKVNLARNSSEPVWQKGFHDHALRREEAIEDVATYLIYNPLRAGLVRDVNDYPYWRSAWHSRG